MAQKRRAEAVARKAEFVLQARTAGHEAMTERLGSVMDASTVTRVWCTCGRYRSTDDVLGVTWGQWRSHAQGSMNADRQARERVRAS